MLAPIEDSRLRVEIGVVLDALLADTRFSWELDSDGAWQPNRARPGRAADVGAGSADEARDGRAKKAASRR